MKSHQCPMILIVGIIKITFHQLLVLLHSIGQLMCTLVGISTLTHLTLHFCAVFETINTLQISLYIPPTFSLGVPYFPPFTSLPPPSLWVYPTSLPSPPSPSTFSLGVPYFPPFTSLPLHLLSGCTLLPSFTSLPPPPSLWVPLST